MRPSNGCTLRGEMTALGITACAAANGLGRDVDAVLDALYSGKRGLRPAPAFIDVPTWVGAIPGELEPVTGRLSAFDTRQARVLTLVLAPMVDAIDAARRRYGGDRIAVLLGTSTAGVADTEAAYARYLERGELPASFDFRRQHAFEAMIALTREYTGISGPGFVISTACSSSARVFASARRLVTAGVVDAALVGGVDSLCALTVRGFRALDVVSEHPCRPFAADRDGINIGEGGALMLIERGEQAVCLLGVGESSDAHHMTAPHPEGRGARAAMLGALAQAGLEPEGFDGHVHTHGTATLHNDAVEAAAILAEIPQAAGVATKGATGHTLGAAGATQAVFAAAALVRDEIPPSVGAVPLDEAAVPLGFVARSGAGRHALCNAFAFGGANASVLLGRMAR